MWRPLSDFRPYYSSKRSKEYLRKTCEFCKKEADRNRYHNFSKEQKDKFRERTREYAAVRRRKEGAPVRNTKRNGYGAGRVAENSGNLGSVDPRPILALARQFCWGDKEIADSAKVDPRRVNDWKNGKLKMGLDAADNLCIALGTHLDIVYDV